MPDRDRQRPTGLAAAASSQQTAYILYGILTILDALTLELLHQASVTDNQPVYRGALAEGP